jgi:hypothetical protein
MPSQKLGIPSINSLTMTYFHTGIRTIIGAKAFHFPVRDGKEWYHLAMVIRHNWLLPRRTVVCRRCSQFIESLYQILIAQPNSLEDSDNELYPP